MEKTSSARRRGPRPAGSDTREAILAAARERFAERGYVHTTMRGVAAAAGVDPRLVLHYFGSKQELFMQSVQLPIDPDAFIARVFDGPPEALAERVAWGLVSTLDEPRTRRTALAIIRAAASEPEAAEVIRTVLTERVLTPLVRRIDADHAELRATMVATQFVGMAMGRHVVGIEPLASAAPEQVVRAITPVI
ncbi:MAG: TetR family transcriptional regulator, partial [Candidatus Limnocylindrales bacterium]